VWSPRWQKQQTVMSESHRFVSDAPGAPIRAGGASPLRVATGGNASWGSKAPSPPLARQHESTARVRPGVGEEPALSDCQKGSPRGKALSFIRKKTTTTKTERKPNEDSYGGNRSA